MTTEDPRAARRREWATELQEIEGRRYNQPLDHTQAAVIRACIRLTDIELAQETR